MATKVKTQLMDKKKVQALKAQKKTVLDEDDFGDNRQPSLEHEESEVVSDGGMSDDTLREDYEGCPRTSSGRSCASRTSSAQQYLERIVDESQTNLGKWLLTQQDSMWERRLNNIGAANSKLLDAKLGGLRR